MATGSSGRVALAWKWNTVLRWYFYADTTPSGMSVDTTETYMRNAHVEWEADDTHCADIGDGSLVDFAYQTGSTARPRSCATTTP